MAPAFRSYQTAGSKESSGNKVQRLFQRAGVSNATSTTNVTAALLVAASDTILDGIKVLMQQMVSKVLMQQMASKVAHATEMSAANAPDKPMSQSELARHFGLSRRTVGRRIRTYVLPEADKYEIQGLNPDGTFPEKGAELRFRCSEMVPILGTQRAKLTKPRA